MILDKDYFIARFNRNRHGIEPPGEIELLIQTCKEQGLDILEDEAQWILWNETPFPFLRGHDLIPSFIDFAMRMLTREGF